MSGASYVRARAYLRSVPEIAKVEPLTTARALRGPFDYRLGAEYAGVDVGSVLVVPFGRRRILGVVTSTASESEVAPERLAEPLSALEADVPAALVRLGLWVAEEYCSTPARGLALVLPPGTGTGSARPLRAKRSLLALADHRGLPFHRTPGTAGLPPDRRPAGTGRRAGARRCPGADFGLRPRRPAPPGGTGAHRAAGHRRAGAAAELADVGAEPEAGELTPAQRAALDQVNESREPLLLHGVPGSGKTEVYLRAVEQTLAVGHSGILLVPEIALTPAMAGQFFHRFGDQVALLHSAFTDVERAEQWRRIRSGAAGVVA